MDSRPIPQKTPSMWYAQDDKARLKMEARGVPRKKIYEAANGETWDKFRMKDGEYLGILGGLRVFGGAVNIKKALERFHNDGAAVVDIETGQDSMAHGVAMFDTATGPRRLTDEDRAIMSEKRSDAYREKHRMASKAEAHRIWHKVGPSIQAKIKATGWSKGALYGAFGRTGSPLGRRPKDFAVVERTALPPIKIKPPRKKSGFVYFMRNGDRRRVKIGYATSLKSRFSSHKGSNASDPILLAAMHGTMNAEHQMHAKFDHLRVRGRRKWFYFRSDLKAFIEALPKIETDLN